MCGGYGINYNKVPEEELVKFFNPHQIQKFKRNGQVQSFFWNTRPVLPVKEDDKIKLYDWGNRDKAAPFPQTGWAKKESLDAGRWRWLHPKNVEIPIEHGYEKRVWFDMQKGTKGILVDNQGDRRAYMITQPADKKYTNQTGHDRMPIGPKKNFKKVKINS